MGIAAPVQELFVEPGVAPKNAAFISAKIPQIDTSTKSAIRLQIIRSLPSVWACVSLDSLIKRTRPQKNTTTTRAASTPTVTLIRETILCTIVQKLAPWLKSPIYFYWQEMDCWPLTPWLTVLTVLAMTIAKSHAPRKIAMPMTVHIKLVRALISASELPRASTNLRPA